MTSWKQTDGAAEIASAGQAPGRAERDRAYPDTGGARAADAC